MVNERGTGRRKLHQDYDLVLGASKLVYFWPAECNLNFAFSGKTNDWGASLTHVYIYL